VTEFTTARSVGGLLPPDVLQAVIANDREMGGLAPTDYGLPPAERVGEAAARAWAKAKNHWASFRSSTEDLPASESGVTQTRDQWLLPLLRDLGFAPTFGAQPEAGGTRRYSVSHRDGPVPLHLLSFRQSLDHGATAASGQRRAAPHAVLQDYLNTAEDELYGVVSNGHLLRLLRKNASLTRQAYLEFDLQEMLEGAVYADFVLLFLVLHRSRFPRTGAEASDCWLERWRARAESQGTRALGKLRDGVAEAIKVLGNGFLRHPANGTLRDRLSGGALDSGGYYRQLLRLVYRLIFLFVAEERDLIFESGANARAKRIYGELYSASRLREVARQNLADDRHDDLWRGLQRTFGLLSGQRPALDVPALGGGLFDIESCPDVDGCLLRNDALAEAIQYLSWVRVGRVARRVSYRNLDAEELGGVYEGLLDRQPRFSAADPEHPVFELVGGGERKQTGSYYTPASLVDELVRSALDPVIADRLAGMRTPADRARALLALAVCDTATGSGHFLLAAARRIAGELARVRAGDREPSPAEVRQALRDVVRHCIHGVDVNPLAVDLCRLSLWLEGHDAGRPLTFLDHRIKLGNSLVGATPGLVADGIPDGAFDPVADDEKAVATKWKRLNRQQRDAQAKEGERQASFLGSGGGVRAAWAELTGSLAEAMRAIGDLPEDAPRQVAEQRAHYEAYRRERIEPARAVLDAWAAAFFWRLKAGAPAPLTSADLHVPPGRPPSLAPEQWRELERLRREQHFFHWSLEFPEVFGRGGFDVVLGNPPWERIKLQEQEFFAEHDPEIAGAPNKAARQRLIDALVQSNPVLARQFAEAKRSAEAQSKFVRTSERFPLTAVGDVNVYALFAEQDRVILNDQGRAGVVVPTGIATDDSTKRFFQDVVDRGSLATLFDFENRKVFFEDVHASYKIALLTLSGARVERGDLAFFLTSVGQLSDDRRRFQLSADDFALLNPNTRTCPIFRTRADADLTRAIYRRVSVLVDERRGQNPWGVEFLRMFDMSNDSGLFRDAPGPGLVPLYEAKLFHQFNHRWATYVDGGDARDASPAELADPAWRIRPRYWVEHREVEGRLSSARGWMLASRMMARATDERTWIVGLLPRSGAGNSGAVWRLPDIIKPRHVAALSANANSLVVDFVVRQKVGGANLNFFIVNQFPVLPPSAYTDVDFDFIVPRVLELTYTAWDLQQFAQDLGYQGPPFAWDEERRALSRAELDAYYAALYGLTRDELRYVLDPADFYGPDFPGETFRVLKERETRQYGEYRTGRLVLETWDRLGLEPQNRDGRYASKPVGQGTPSDGTPSSRVDRTIPATIARDADKLAADGGSASLLSPQVVRVRSRTTAHTLPLPPVEMRSDSQVPPASDHPSEGGTSEPSAPTKG
jgi:hypothetical protein